MRFNIQRNFILSCIAIALSGVAIELHTGFIQSCYYGEESENNFDVALIGNALSFTMDGETEVVDLSQFTTPTDYEPQTLTMKDDVITLSQGGGSIDLSYLDSEQEDEPNYNVDNIVEWKTRDLPSKTGDIDSGKTVADLVIEDKLIHQSDASEGGELTRQSHFNFFDHVGDGGNVYFPNGEAYKYDSKLSELYFYQMGYRVQYGEFSSYVNHFDFFNAYAIIVRDEKFNYYGFNKPEFHLISDNERTLAIFNDNWFKEMAMNFEILAIITKMYE